jgi:hypothetical protein
MIDEMLARFPKLKDALMSLMGNDYQVFISDIKYVAPKPTTFQIDLGDEHFNLMWAGNKMGFVCEVQGKKYYLTYLNEKATSNKSYKSFTPLRINQLLMNQKAEEGG